MRILSGLVGHLRAIDRISLFRTRRGVRANRSRAIAAGMEEVEVLTAGRAYFSDGGREHAIGSGAVLWHLAGESTVHRTEPDDPYHCVVIAFAVAGPPRQRAPRLSVPRDPDEVRAFALGLLDQHLRGGGDPAWSALHAYVSMRQRVAVDGPPILDRHPMIERIRTVVALRAQGRITAEDIAGEAGIGVAQLHALVRRHLGSTPWRLIAERRLAEARRLLATTDLAVAEVGRQVGWPDAVHFGRIFRQLQGSSPGAWRRVARGPL